MKPSNEKLIDYLDRQLNQEESVGVESALKLDKDLDKEWLYLNLAIDTVRLDAINQKVTSIRQLQVKNETSEKPEPAVIHNIYKISFRVAAIIVLFICVASVYKYGSVSNQSFYNKQFTGYELSNRRGQEAHNEEVDAYRNNNWNEVVSNFKAGENKSNQRSFLAAMAEMHLNHFPDAISIFENIIFTKSADKDYVEESEYYLSLAYLMNHQGAKAIQIINKIKSNPNHLYYPIVSKYASIDLKIIELKNN
jgi:hypothetical protein